MSTENQFNPPQPTGAIFWRKEETISDVTLRDYFAAKAMQAVFTSEWTSETGYSDVARRAYRMADAMLAARSIE